MSAAVAGNREPLTPDPYETGVMGRSGGRRQAKLPESQVGLNVRSRCSAVSARGTHLAVTSTVGKMCLKSRLNGRNQGEGQELKKVMILCICV